MLRLVFEMAPLSPRQEKAAGLTRWLADMNAFVTSPLPLDPARTLRFQVLNEDRDAVLAKLREQDFSPRFCSVNLRAHRDSFVPCTTYELDLPPDRPVVEDRTIRGEIAERDKAAEKAARTAFLRELGYLKKNESA
jgi:hypothetical protein